MSSSTDCASAMASERPDHHQHEQRDGSDEACAGEAGM